MIVPGKLESQILVCEIYRIHNGRSDSDGERDGDKSNDHDCEDDSDSDGNCAGQYGKLYIMMI